MTRAQLRAWARRVADAYGSVNEAFSQEMAAGARAVLELTAPIGPNEVEIAVGRTSTRSASSYVEGYRDGAARRGRR